MEIVRGTQDIAEGAASLALEPADEELATLARAIDRMAGRIAEGRRRLTREKKLIELMVENINAAVVSLDAERRVVLHNRVARELLGARVGQPIGDGRGAPTAASWRRWRDSPPRAATGRGSARIRLAGEEDQPREWSLVWAPLPGPGRSGGSAGGRGRHRGAARPAARGLGRDGADHRPRDQEPADADPPLRRAHAAGVARGPEQFDEVFERCTKNILQQVEELRIIAMEFSTYSKIPRIERRETDLAATLAEVVAAYEAAPRGAAGVRWTQPGAPLRLEIDARLLRRAVRNLIENALRVSPPGRGGRRGAGDRRRTRRSSRVADRGPGVDPELLGKIFDPYFSTHDTGTGLGLPIARRIAESHGGSMRARNRRHGGLEVSIRLPLAAPWSPAPKTLRRPAAQAG